MRKLTFGMNLSLDGYIAASGDDLGWGVPSDELFQWWSDRVGATGLALYGRKLWETMSSHWPTADQQPGATPARIEFARRWLDMPKAVFSSTTSAVDWNAHLVTGDAVTEITQLKTEDGGPMDVGGATLAAAPLRGRPLMPRSVRWEGAFYHRQRRCPHSSNVMIGSSRSRFSECQRASSARSHGSTGSMSDIASR
jgi:dihydrofolate reductase